MVTTIKNVKGFYQLDNTVLTFDPLKDVLKLQFNQIIMQKENISRLNTDLDKGQFYLSLHDVMIRLNITINKARKLIKDFVDLGIITMIKKGKSKNDLSVYKYNTVTEIIETAVQDPKEDPIDDINDAEGMDPMEQDPPLMDYDFIEDDLLEKIDFISEFGYVVDVSDQALLTLIKTMNWGDLEKALKISAVNGGRTLKYALKVYINNEYKDLNTYKPSQQNKTNKPKKQNRPKNNTKKTETPKKEFTPNCEPQYTADTVEPKDTKKEEKPFDFIGEIQYKRIVDGEQIIKAMYQRALQFAIDNDLDVDMVKGYVETGKVI